MTAEDMAAWIGRTERVEDDISPAQAAAAAAMLEPPPPLPAKDSALPPLWHWFYFLPRAPQSQLGIDGHPQRGGFIPPIPYPRRMFAGARIRFHQPLIIGQPAWREGIIRNVTQKSGRSGPLAFVTVGYNVYQNDSLCIEEEQDIVYREPGAPIPAPVPVDLPPPPPGAWVRTVTPDTRLLFRFSALTFNAHRIHYDRPYAKHEEGYPGLVVHGPLTAVLLMELVRHNVNRPIIGFSFRSQAPLFDLAPFRLIAAPADDRVELTAQGPDGMTSLSAVAELGKAEY
ncbi:acyl-CoA dehydrogenase [Roseiflexus sp.]|uniref:acyl-CoA dehydrogenase n=1 Tax=Roseiflexus sp. TaxID=2562120 RepID=UPI0021DDDD20|nr:acyl-CoA dehydrogenase [Roseiflexus sp.]GIV99834.1 MAG: mesaconyl-C(4)-CoA hydratase [Roseiflexus sp.]